MIRISEESSLFITGFDLETNMIQFRTAYEPNYLQSEKVDITGDKVETKLYFFHRGFLDKFLRENGK